MDEQLYLFEVLIDDIHFEDSVKEVPTKKQLIISVTLGSLATLEIRSETLPLKGGEGSNKRHVEFKCGKSYLCPFSADNLLEALNRKPVEIAIAIKGDVEPICTSSVEWADSFKELIMESKDIRGFVTPASITHDFNLTDNGIDKGTVQMFLRLSCFGKSLQTQYEVNQDAGNRQFVFKSPYMMTTFMCSRYGIGDSTDFLPISTMYTISGARGSAPERTTPSNPSVSWTVIAKSHPDTSYRSSAQSECFFPEYLNIVPPMKISTMTFDIVSLMDRPEEEKFIDFLSGRRVSYPHDTQDETTTRSNDSEGKGTIIFFTDSRPITKVQTVGKESDSASDKVSKACQCPNTPIVCNHVLDAIKRYEKSHPDLMIYGKKVKYDKIFRNSNAEKNDSILRLRGGNDEENIPPFKHKKGKGCYNLQCKMAKQLKSVGLSQLAEISSKQINKQENYFCADFYCPESTRQNLALQVKFSEDEIPFKFSCQNKYCPAAKMFKKLGLGPLSIEKCQGTIYGPVKPPIQYGISQTYGIFDTYGPFGIFSTTDTPFLPDYEKRNKIKEPNQDIIEGNLVTKRGDRTSHYDMAPCTYKTCQVMYGKLRCEDCAALAAGEKPSTEISSKIDLVKHDSREVLRLRGGGASERIYILPNRLRAGAPSKSPIAECQEVMEQFDKILEEYRNALNSSGHEMVNRFEEYMPASKTANCGHARCTYISEPILPPIHWDCPDPLPVGFCQNPDCPYLPQDLKRFTRILAEKRKRNTNNHSETDLQSHSLRYSCSSDPEHSITDYDLCTFKSKCPFSNPPKIVNIMQIGDNFAQHGDEAFLNSRLTDRNSLNSPLHKGNIFQPCSNPDCPLKLKETFQSCSNPDCPQKLMEFTDSCSNPECPLKYREISEPCSNPDCPLREETIVESCSNPECPLKQKQISEHCSNPECPFLQASEESCHNPDCPFKIKDSSSSTETCENPDCLLKHNKQFDSCDNPECPFKSEILEGICNAKSASECVNPNCAVHKQSCSNPDCPLKTQEMEKCENPKCPYKYQQPAKARGICGPSSRSICGDATCPFQTEADGDKNRNKEDQAKSSKSRDGGGDKKQTEAKSLSPVQEQGEAYKQGTLETTKGDRPSHYDMAPCTTKTCEFMGGKLPCLDCATATLRKTSVKICPGTMKCPVGSRHSSHIRKPRTPESAKRSLKRERKKFVYHLGDTYPGTHVGHKECVITPLNVPAKMGWLWNVHTPCLQLRHRNGWRPGLIGKTILDVIQAHRRAQNMSLLEQGKRKRKNQFGIEESESEIVYPKPTLQIKKRDGVYYITMNPLKDPRTLVNNENPYMECTPMQFKIIKNKDNNDYKSCVCNDQGILYEESSSSDSELDVEFTPPAGVIRPERFIKPRDVIHTDTQYNTQDFAILIEKPKTDIERESSEEKTRDKGKKSKTPKKNKEKNK